MKKITALILALVLCLGCVFTLASCSPAESGESDPVVKVINYALTEEQYAFAVPKGDTEMLNAINEFLAQIQANGKFDEIVNKYFGDGTPTAVTSASTMKTDGSQLIVATNAAFAPFEYMEGDSYYGIDMEIAALLAEELGKELVINNMKFDSVCLSVGEHKCDIAMAGLTVNESRKEVVNFSKSYYNAYQKLIVRADDTTFDNCTDAASVDAILNATEGAATVGFQNGTTAFYYVTGDADWGFDGLDVQPKGYDNGALAVQDLINGNIDYVIIDADPATRIAQNFNAID